MVYKKGIQTNGKTLHKGGELMSIISGTIAALAGANATRSAANTAADATRSAADTSATVQREAMAQSERLNQPFYDVGKAAIPEYQKMVSGGYDMKESPAAQYELTKGTRAMNRALASRGLSGSGNAVNRLTELNQSVAAKDWQNQYSRILDALKLGTGASASMGAASTSGANALSNSAMQTGSNLGNIAMQQGANQASLYSGMGGLTSNAAATGLKGYDLYSKYNAPAATVATSAPGVGEAGLDYAANGIWFV
jgi:hypothetical protein